MQNTYTTTINNYHIQKRNRSLSASDFSLKKVKSFLKTIWPFCERLSKVDERPPLPFNSWLGERFYIYMNNMYLLKYISIYTFQN